MVVTSLNLVVVFFSTEVFCAISNKLFIDTRDLQGKDYRSAFIYGLSVTMATIAMHQLFSLATTTRMIYYFIRRMGRARRLEKHTRYDDTMLTGHVTLDTLFKLCLVKQ